MPAGRYRHRATFTDPQVTGQDSFGQDTVTAVEIGTFWCLVEGLRGAEKEAAQQRWAKALYRIEMNHQPGIRFKAKMTAEWNGLTLNILEVQDTQSSLRPKVYMTAEDFEE